MMYLRYGCMGLMIGAAVLLAGCPPQGELPFPPFNATGVYAGTWSGETEKGSETPQEVTACPLELDLTQDVAADWPQRMAVSGTAYIDYSCIELPEWAEQEPTPSLVNVGGVMDENGKLGLLTGACGTGLCVALGLDGTGEDIDGDGMMDRYSGTWSYSLLLAGFTPFTIEGDFVTEFGMLPMAEGEGEVNL